MVTLALIQGVVNTFVIFLSRVVGYLVDRVLPRMAGYGPGFWITTIVAEIVLGILATMIVMWFSKPPRVSCGCGRRGARRAPENDRGAGAAQAQSRTIDVARAGQGVRNCRGR